MTNTYAIVSRNLISKMVLSNPLFNFVLVHAETRYASNYALNWFSVNC